MSDAIAWVCFHCGYQADNEVDASAHFGDRDDPALCRTWAELNSDGKLAELQSLTAELSAEREQNVFHRLVIEGLEYRLLEYENLAASRFKGCKSLNDAFKMYDSMEGRALTAELKLDMLFKAVQKMLTNRRTECA